MDKKQTSTALVSACLLGVSCKYDGGNNRNEEVIRLAEKMRLIPVCPEQLGGLTTPRTPAVIIGECVHTKDGKDVTKQFRKGAREALRLAQLFKCECAILKANSPSCGCGSVYDGTFSGRKVSGDGVTAALLKENGIRVCTEKEIENREELS